MAIVRIVVGLLLLVAGRKLFWLVVGAIGFLMGVWFTTEFLHTQSEVPTIIIAIGIGILGALLAVFLQKISVVLAGFLAGGYLAFTLIHRFSWDTLQYPWLPVLLGAIIGAIFTAMLFEWALILLSSVTGAYFIVQVVDGSSEMSLAFFAVLSIAGILIQASSKKRKRGAKEERAKQT